MKKNLKTLLCSVMVLSIFTLPLVGCGTNTTTDGNNTTNGTSTNGTTDNNNTNTNGTTTNNNKTENENTKRAQDISTKVMAVKGVSKNTVVVNDNTAVVGVRLEKADMTIDDSMRTAIEDAVKEVDPNITTVRITNDETLFGRIEKYG